MTLTSQGGHNNLHHRSSNNSAILEPSTPDFILRSRLDAIHAEESSQTHISLYDNHSVHSLISEEDVSTISKMDEINGEMISIIKKSTTRPDSLIGWRINVHGMGVGHVSAIKKRLGMPTLFKIEVIFFNDLMSTCTLLSIFYLLIFCS